ncbi:GPI ethanolamine phosphate transferase 2 isoform X2 [Heterocephalus glaber]|uniref:GPI ethanolamine phosphate transferase 2 isoform X1 n=3 Tax=Heterocephalus glaber TaxID=10181 RepID=A0AAX6QXN4_HETGA|nr:GPI ethanolamine phosphate transferase 2 isoform X1 [Heterocephalus glaber]XP_012928505.1 GPI ethanolamine phosphate transferase 2 isoform X2 [Heterocephalus glaber]
MRLGSGAFATICVAIEVLGVAIFLRGFFPASVKSSSRTGLQAEPPAPEPLAGASSNWTKLPLPLFSKAVIVLIDALRDDFVFGSKGARYMPFTTYLVGKGPSHSFVAEAKPPTVTMPRIKALMTGSLPGFVDVIRNLNSPALLEDNVIRQAKAAGKRMIFYGDETWVKLFPKHFVEYDGTTSFFVSDYTEVDNNVTRHLERVLKRGDWDILILHYLGLDHIGHVSGPESPLIGRKLREMDGILMKIYTALLTKERETLSPSLLVLCGDHGMSETGSHGAASAEEVRTPLVLVSSAFERKPDDIRHPTQVQQTDLAATLAIGLGFPIPKDSIGSLLFPVVERRPMREQLRFLHLNAIQLSRLLQENVPSYEKDPGFEQFVMAEKLHGNWVKLHLEEDRSGALLNLGTKVARQYLGALRTLSLALSTHVAQYDTYSMAVGTIIVLETLILLLLSIPQVLRRRAELEVPLSSPVFSLLFYLMFLVLSAIHVVVCTSAESSCYLCSLPWLAAGGVMVLVSALLCVIASAFARMVMDSTFLRKVQQSAAHPCSGWSEVGLLLLLGTVGHVLSLGASSFVEEEHQTWYFLVNTLCLALSQETCRSYFLGDDSKLQCYFHTEPGTVGATCMRQDCTACEAPKAGQASKGLPSGARGGHTRWAVLAGPWLVLACCRLLRSLNHTGVQGAHRPDLSHWLTSPSHRMELSCLAALSLLAVFLLAQRGCSPVVKVALALGLLGVFCYRAATGNLLFPWQPANRGISKGILEARFVYVFVLGILFMGTKDLLRSQVIAADFKVKTVGLWELYSGLVLLAALLLRPHNLPVLTFSLLIQTIMTKFIWKPLRHDVAEITVMHYWFGQAFFYFQGNSNNIATIDISSGFVGLDTYMEIPATFLTVFGTYVGPVLWAGHLAHFLSAEASGDSAMGRACFCYALICSVPVATYIILVTSLRYHLFIWSVFSPKLLYEGMHLLITAALCVLFTATNQTGHTSAWTKTDARN